MENSKAVGEEKAATKHKGKEGEEVLRNSFGITEHKHIKKAKNNRRLFLHEIEQITIQFLWPFNYV